MKNTSTILLCAVLSLAAVPALAGPPFRCLERHEDGTVWILSGGERLLQIRNGVVRQVPGLFSRRSHGHQLVLAGTNLYIGRSAPLLRRDDRGHTVEVPIPEFLAPLFERHQPADRCSDRSFVISRDHETLERLQPDGSRELLPLARRFGFITTLTVEGDTIWLADRGHVVRVAADGSTQAFGRPGGNILGIQPLPQGTVLVLAMRDDGVVELVELDRSGNEQVWLSAAELKAVPEQGIPLPTVKRAARSQTRSPAGR